MKGALKVIFRELKPSDIKDTEVNSHIDLRIGDVMVTLQNALVNIDLLLLDGCNDLYLPLIKILEPKLKKEAYIYTDKINFTGSKPFLKYIKSNPKKYNTKQLSESKGGVVLTKYTK